MKYLLATLILAASAVGLPSLMAPAEAVEGQRGLSQPVEFEHGGGCRKSSPPGQCCHMDNSTKTVHCH